MNPRPLLLVLAIACGAPPREGTMPDPQDSFAQEVVATTTLPAALKRRALDKLDRWVAKNPNLSKARLGPARAMYRPDVEGPAYFEVALVVNADRVGYLVLSTGEHDMAIAESALGSKSPMDALLASASTAVKVYRFAGGTLVAEDTAGKVVARKGNLPTVDGKTERAWVDLKAKFKTDFKAPLLKQRADATAESKVLAALQLNGRGLMKGQTRFIRSGEQTLRSYDVTGPARDLVSVSQVRLNNGEYALAVTAISARALVEGVTLTYAGETFPFMVMAVRPVDADPDTVFIAPEGTVATNGSVASTSSALTTTEVMVRAPYPAYSQARRTFTIGPASVTCPSGCGPTAWAMMLGWYDNATGTTSASTVYQRAYTPGVLGLDARASDSLQWQLNDDMGSVCVIGAEQTFTVPFFMDDIDAHLARQNILYSPQHAGFAVRSNYNVLSVDDDDYRDDIFRGVVVERRPSIAGLGVFEHYALVVGAQEEQEVLCENGTCRNVAIAANFGLIMGWGSSDVTWRPAGAWYRGQLQYRSGQSSPDCSHIAEPEDRLCCEKTTLCRNVNQRRLADD